MPHPYPLHTDVSAPCYCCRAVQPFRFLSASDQVVCTFCAKHQGSDKAERRDTEHVTMWLALFAEERDAYQQFVASTRLLEAENVELIALLKSQVSELSGAIADDFATVPASGARSVLENEVIRRAERNTELAHRRNDRAMAAIWLVASLHRDDTAKPVWCICGRPTSRCPEGLAIDSERQDLAAWEARNLELLRTGQRHGLPANHPAIPVPAEQRRRR